jgi:hypothetical protein
MAVIILLIVKEYLKHEFSHETQHFRSKSTERSKPKNNNHHFSNNPSTVIFAANFFKVKFNPDKINQPNSIFHEQK